MSFVPHYDVLTHAGTTPSRVVFVLHGILGSGRNWRTIARRLCQRRPDTAFVTIDLRNHGESQGAPGPHTLSTTARDLLAVAEHTGPPAEVIGHSFGGKVALRYAELRPADLERVWVLDSRADAEPPDPSNDVLQVLAALRTIPIPLTSRDELVERLGQMGFSPMLSRWMTTNLRRTDRGFEWTFDLDAVDAMIDDYWHQDLWPVLRAPPCDIEVIRAGRSDRWPPAILEQFEREAAANVRLHVMPNAGHWLHADDPEGLLDRLAPTEP